MILELFDGERVEIFRQTCGYMWSNSSGKHVHWNIDPIDIIYRRAHGFFVVIDSGKREYYENGVFDPSRFSAIIPVHSVKVIREPSEWDEIVEHWRQM